MRVLFFVVLFAGCGSAAPSFSGSWLFAISRQVPSTPYELADGGYDFIQHGDRVELHEARVSETGQTVSVRLPPCTLVFAKQSPGVASYSLEDAGAQSCGPVTQSSALFGSARDDAPDFERTFTPFSATFTLLDGERAHLFVNGVAWPAEGLVIDTVGVRK